jgi:dienelactone hydrolase
MNKDFEYNSVSDALVIIFSSYGLEGRPGETAFAQPRFEFVRALADERISSLFVMDRNQHWYHSGVCGLAETIPDLADALTGYASNHKRVMALGHSMGGYAALLFTALCGFDHAVSTAPQASILREHRLAWDDKRWSVKIPEARQHSSTPQYFDIRDAIRASPGSRYSVYHSHGDKRDTAHAQHLRSVGHVDVTELEGADHNSARVLRDTGMLKRILSDFARRPE